jgi:hypothetical protein
LAKFALVGSALAAPIVLWTWYPWWTPLVSILPLATVALYLSRSTHLPLEVSEDEASRLLDHTLMTKDRVQSFTSLSRS